MSRLRWFGQLQARHSGYIGKRILKMELSGRRKRGRSQKGFMNLVNVDMQTCDREGCYRDRVRWKKMISSLKGAAKRRIKKKRRSCLP